MVEASVNTIRGTVRSASVAVRRRPRVHQWVPLWAFAVAARAGVEFRARWRPDRLAEAERAMAYLVGATERAPEVSDLARRHLFIQSMRVELEARPSVISNQTVHNHEVFARLRAEGRGALFNFMHHGFYAGAMASFGAHGVTVHTAAAPQYFDVNPAGYWGMRNMWHVRSVQMNGTPMFPAAGSFAYMEDLLRRGEVVALAHDFPGQTLGTFLGRQVGSRSGVARLALQTRAPIVVVSAHPRGLIGEFHAHEPIEPRDFDTVQDLQQEILRRHEPAVLAWPEALVTPLTRWTPDERSEKEFGAVAQVSVSGSAIRPSGPVAPHPEP